MDIVEAEWSAGEEGKDVRVHSRSGRLHYIESERVAIPLVGVQDSETRIESHCEERNAALGLEDCVEVVKDRADRVDSDARGARQQ
jgi:hypothetical protein